MSSSAPSVAEPISISRIGGRYLIFDIDVVTHLRRAHRICGTPVGTLPRAPQQNVFSGLPMELMPEEACLLVETGVAYIMDDLTWHKENFPVAGHRRSEYLEEVHLIGLRASRAQENALQSRKQTALAKQAAAGARAASLKHIDTADADDEDTISMFHTDRSSSRASSTPTSGSAWAVTPTISYSTSPSQHDSKSQADVSVPSSYPLFVYLHMKGYYMWPGLRFGCDYNVYPGDPMRFHAHFDAVSFDWEEEIDMMHLVGGGRLGTRVKKAFLIGGKDEDKLEEENPVRTFSIEWGGM
ncbi:hypothetical protein BJ878DRAFT_417469 [Calycina marina]|uniref:tRNA-splicing endonuclease subunit Sen34 n=1 Tax=Calycina marina TaxID=1763456 RepID=A0A9P7Z5Y1_9HELO|nr:hypothetical protein BJ878DRAFT_417469 [Calycina marina]